MRRNLTRNPNRGKRHAARLASKPTRAKASRVRTSYVPGKTIDARIRGIQDYYDRQAAIAALS